MGGDPAGAGGAVFGAVKRSLLDLERVTLAAAAFNLIFIPVALMTHPHWGPIGHAFATWRPLPRLTMR